MLPEGRGFLNGWTMLVEKIREMGFKPRQEDIPMRTVTAGPSKGGGSRSKNIVTWGGGGGGGGGGKACSKGCGGRR